jgi:hypothetical protein
LAEVIARSNPSRAFPRVWIFCPGFSLMAGHTSLFLIPSHFSNDVFVFIAAQQSCLRKKGSGFAYVGGLCVMTLFAFCFSWTFDTWEKEAPVSLLFVPSSLLPRRVLVLVLFLGKQRREQERKRREDGNSCTTITTTTTTTYLLTLRVPFLVRLAAGKHCFGSSLFTIHCRGDSYSYRIVYSTLLAAIANQSKLIHYLASLL